MITMIPFSIILYPNLAKQYVCWVRQLHCDKMMKPPAQSPQRKTYKLFVLHQPDSELDGFTFVLDILFLQPPLGCDKKAEFGEPFWQATIQHIRQTEGGSVTRLKCRLPDKLEKNFYFGVSRKSNFKQVKMNLMSLV